VATTTTSAKAATSFSAPSIAAAKPGQRALT
jgi:hypothetical protein